MKTKVKICGVRTKEIAELCNDLKVDYLGMNFVPGTKRYISTSAAMPIRKQIKFPKVVGVFVNANPKHINEIGRELKLDFVQLHGQETPEFCASIDLPVIKAIPIGTKNDLRLAEMYKKVVQYLLFDTKSDKNFGGSGKEFDRKILKNYNLDLPFFLAGGLNASNLRQAIVETKPFAVDIASGCEENGEQSAEKIRELIRIIRAI